MNQTVNSTSVSHHATISDQLALEFALAHYHWCVLSGDQEQWNDAQKQRRLAAAFLRYHAAKLALTAEAPPFQ